ncbi:hypothetical protein GCM10010505_52010 [Kitasatospora aburaviensis]
MEADDEGDRLRSEHLLRPVDARTGDSDDRSGGGGAGGSLICSHEQDTPKTVEHGEGSSGGNFLDLNRSEPHLPEGSIL